MTSYPEPEHTGPDGPDRVEWWSWNRHAVGVTTCAPKDGDDTPRVCVAYTDTGEPTGGSYRVYALDDLADALAWAWERNVEEIFDDDAPTAGTSWECARCGAVITAENHDYDLREYHIRHPRVRGYYPVHTPHNLRAQAEDVARLDAGECPLCDRWEDGEGGTYADCLLVRGRK